jgi:hypothetical protein
MNRIVTLRLKIRRPNVGALQQDAWRFAVPTLGGEITCQVISCIRCRRVFDSPVPFAIIFRIFSRSLREIIQPPHSGKDEPDGANPTWLSTNFVEPPAAGRRAARLIPLA